MKRNMIFYATFLCIAIYGLFAGGCTEGGGSNRGTYLSRGGYIIHPDEIKIENFIAQYDYDYPLPESGDFNLILKKFRR